ncbi:MAG: YcdB/YcdC domain-containing protein [Bacillota bacterium]
MQGKGWMAVLTAMVLLSVGVASGAGPGAPGPEPAISAAGAVDRVRELLELPEAWGPPRTERQERPEGPAWAVEWDSDAATGRPWALAVIDGGSGQLLEYQRADFRREDRPRLMRYTRSEAESLASRWVERLLPAALRAEVALSDLPPYPAPLHEPVHAFRWQRQALGYPVLAEGAVLEIDGATGELRAFRLTWDREAAFAQPGPVLSREEALEAFHRGLPVSLVYHPVSHGALGQPGGYALLYRPVTGSVHLSQQGELLDLAGRPLPAPGQEPRLLPAPERPYQPPAEPLSLEELIARAQAIAGRSEPPFDQWSEQVGDPSSPRTLWSFFLGSSFADLVEVTIEQETGLLHRLTYLPAESALMEQAPWKLSRAEAEEVAIAFLRTHRPDLTGEVALSSYVDPGLTEGLAILPVSFRHLHRGIPLEDLSIMVLVDMRTGQVSGFWHTHRPVLGALPEPVGLIGAEEARSRYIEALGLQLGWQRFLPEPGHETPPPQLVWSLGHGVEAHGVDGRTGLVLDWHGRPVQVGIQPTRDAAGHYAGRELELLWAQGVIEAVGGELKPDSPVAAGEAIRWLVLATQPARCCATQGLELAPVLPPGSPLGKALAADPYLRRALQAGIIQPADFEGEVDLAAPVSRERFALWAVRALGHGRVAAMEVPIPLRFVDGPAVGERYANAVAILSGLSILRGDGQGRFHPREPLTRGAAAKIIYAVAAELAGP